MHCEQALLLISAELDREIDALDRAALEEHLHECHACAATAEAFRLQDFELHSAFAPRREAVAVLAERVIDRLASVAAPGMENRPTLSFEEGRRLRRVRRFLGSAMAAAAAVAGIALIWHAVRSEPPAQVEMANRRLP